MSRANKAHKRRYRSWLRKKINEGPYVWHRYAYVDEWAVSRYTKAGHQFVGAYRTKEQAMFEVEFLKLLDQELSKNERDCSS